jgi:hypothetical protein
MARRKKRGDNGEGGEHAETHEEKEAPVTFTKATKENPAGIESVSEEHAEQLGKLVGNGGPGAAGCTVAGPVIFHATEGGTKPLPDHNLPEDVELEGGAAAGDDQPTSQQAAALSGSDAPEPEQQEEIAA